MVVGIHAKGWLLGYRTFQGDRLVRVGLELSAWVAHALVLYLLFLCLFLGL